MIVDAGAEVHLGVSCSQTSLEKRDEVECSVTVGDHCGGLALWRYRVSWLCLDISMKDVLKAMEC